MNSECTIECLGELIFIYFSVQTRIRINTTINDLHSNFETFVNLIIITNQLSVVTFPLKAKRFSKNFYCKSCTPELKVNCTA